jgi:hypothetical protein
MESSRIKAAKERAEKAKTAILSVALIAFFGAIALERGAHAASSSNQTQPIVTSNDSDDSDDGFGFFDDGGVAPSQGPPSGSTGTS